jgi:predicted ribosomally synthesized peptide with SipW-like signal peptide
MKNTTFRKKALLSSVAMLLVALVALGSATFAWFSSNKTVTADGMKVTSAAAQGLVISDDNGKVWGNTSTLLQLVVTLVHLL